jgi:periplasmic protein TonB
MFNNLIESTSHAKEFRRRGSFVLLTTVTYAVLLVIGGIASVYAYDAHLDSQSTELEITFIPPVLEAAQPAPPKNTIPRPASNSERAPTQSERTVLITSTADPNRVPDHIGVIASDVPPARADSIVSTRNVDPPAPAFSGRGVPGGTGNTPAVVIDTPPPPPAATPKPEIPKVLKVSQGVLTSKVLNLPRPTYPPLAKQLRLQGSVSIQVLIDENGKVVSAKAVSGHQVLVNAAEAAALQARFSPTLLSGQPVKVSGVIIYNFVLP